MNSKVTSDRLPSYIKISRYSEWLDTFRTDLVHTVVPPDDGPRYARNMYSLTKYTKNKLCIKLVFLDTIKLCAFVAGPYAQPYCARRTSGSSVFAIAICTVEWSTKATALLTYFSSE